MILNVDNIIGATKQRHPYLKESITSGGIGTFQSLWKANGYPGAGATPSAGSGDIPTNSTTGSLAQTNPGTNNFLYLGSMTTNMGTTGVLVLYDRLVEISGLSGNIFAAQTINSTALTRYTSGNDVELWLEVYSPTGSLQVNVTASYTNQAGTSGQTTPSVPFFVSPVAGQMMQLPLAAGDTGVKSVQSITLSASTTTAGNWGITLLKRLAEVPMNTAGTGLIQDVVMLGMPQVQNNACIAGMVLCSTTSTGLIQSAITTFEG